MYMTDSQFYSNTIAGLVSDDILSANITTAGVAAKIAQNSQSYFYLKDEIGSISDISDANGNHLQHFVYSAFGEKLATQDGSGNDISANPVLNTTYSFAGRELDPESGLYYNRARYYDPNTGRFLQQDPTPGALNLPTTIANSYNYAGNNPFNLVDPSGRSVWSFIGDVFVAAVIIVAAIIIGPAIAAAVGLDGIAAVIASALVGAAVGGVVGGTLFQALGLGTFQQGLDIGLALGFTGGLAGGLGLGGTTLTSASNSLSSSIGSFLGIGLLSGSGQLLATSAYFDACGVGLIGSQCFYHPTPSAPNYDPTTNPPNGVNGTPK
jgi:RHS repeat-associated protein